MRADDDVHRAVCHACERGAGFFAAVEARKLGNFDGEIGETVGKILRVLLYQKRSRREHGDLFAAHHGNKGGTQGDFGFAEAHVAAYQSIHRAGLG